MEQDVWTWGGVENRSVEKITWIDWIDLFIECYNDYGIKND
jgi:hypothetical protein